MNTQRMPVLFLGHGSPMNAIADSPFTKALGSLANRIVKPRVILVVSAHWITEGSWVIAMPKPRTIHDFYGFPQKLFDIQYPASGSPETAEFLNKNIVHPPVQLDTKLWGLDHGTWSVLLHMYPEANIPVVQLSIDIKQPPEYHIKLGQELSKLRDKGVLIIGSGNVVHNLSKIKYETNAEPYDWALEFDSWLKQKLTDRDFSSVLHQFHNTKAGELSVPTLDHYYPLHYILGAADNSDELKFEYEEIQNASISMRCLSLTAKE